jgi:drug/metabolite transporter superfamily protein YnfA
MRVVGVGVVVGGELIGRCEARTHVAEQGRAYADDGAFYIIVSSLA